MSEQQIAQLRLPIEKAIAARQHEIDSEQTIAAVQAASHQIAALIASSSLDETSIPVPTIHSDVLKILKSTGIDIDLDRKTVAVPSRYKITVAKPVAVAAPPPPVATPSVQRAVKLPPPPVQKKRKAATVDEPPHTRPRSLDFADAVDEDEADSVDNDSAELTQLAEEATTRATSIASAAARLLADPANPVLQEELRMATAN